MLYKTTLFLWLGLLLLVTNVIAQQTTTDTLNAKNKKQLKEVGIVSQKDFLEHKTDRTIVNISALLSNTSATAADALSQAPGVEVNETGVSLRGRDGVVIFIDDKPTHLSGKDLIDYLKALPAGTLDKIEIMPIPPAQYNAGGTAGVINIKTKKTSTQGLNGNLITGFNQGILQKLNNSFNFNYKTGNLNFFGNAGYTRNNNYYDVNWKRVYSVPSQQLSPVLDQHNTETSTTNSITYRLGVDYDLSKKTSMGILFSCFTIPYTEQGDYELHFLEPNNLPDSNIAVNSHLNQHSSYASVNFNLHHQFNTKGNQLSINLDYLDHDVRSNQTSASNTYLSNGAFIGNYTLLSNNSFPAQVYGARVDYNFSTPFGFKWSTGLQSTLSIRHNTGLYNNPVGNNLIFNYALSNTFYARENINSAYLSLQTSYKRLEVQAGLRLENTNSTARQEYFTNVPNNGLTFNYTDIFPTLYLSYRLGSAAGNTLNFSAGRRIDRPNYADLNPSVFFFDRYTSFTGNPVLQPSYATNAELSYNHGSLLSAGLLFSSTNNQITSAYILADQAIVMNNYNLSRVNNYGAYINPSVTVSHWLILTLYTEVDRTNYDGIIANGIILNSIITSFRATGNGQLKLNKGWSAELSGLYRSNRSLGQGFYLPIWQLNSSAQKKLLNNKAAITLTARDIFHTYIINRQVEVQTVHLTRVIANDTQLIGLAFSYKFGASGVTREHKTAVGSEASRVGGN